MLKVFLAIALIGLPVAAANGATTNRQAPSTIYIGADSTDAKPVNYREIAAVILVVAGCVGLLVGQIYFIVRAFSVSAVWGVFMLLFNGLTILFFCLFEFERARRPLVIMLLGLSAIVTGIFLPGLKLTWR